MDTGTTYDTIVYAGFWRRFAAFLIDIVIVLVITNVIELALWLSGNISASKTTVSFFSYRLQAPFPIVTVPFHPLCLLVGWPYFAGLESSARRATIGKMTLSIYVTDYSGGRIGFGRATARYWAKWLVSALFTGSIGFLMAGFTERKQALHDMIVRSVVVKAFRNRGR